MVLYQPSGVMTTAVGSSVMCVVSVSAMELLLVRDVSVICNIISVQEDR